LRQSPNGAIMARMVARLCIVLSCLPLALLGGCSSGSQAPKCIPGASAACSCPTGQQGAQTCNAAGTFAACVCATAGLDAGGPVGAGGTTGPSSLVGTGGTIGPVTSPADASTAILETGRQSIAVDSGSSGESLGGATGAGGVIGEDAPIGHGGIGGVVATGGTVSTGGMVGAGGIVGTGGTATTGTDWYSLPACGVTVQANINTCGSPWPSSQTPCQFACTDNAGHNPPADGKPCKAQASGLYGVSWVVCIPDISTSCETYCPQPIPDPRPEVIVHRLAITREGAGLWRSAARQASVR
jgi:hypothetical protein